MTLSQRNHGNAHRDYIKDRETHQREERQKLKRVKILQGCCLDSSSACVHAFTACSLAHRDDRKQTFLSSCESRKRESLSIRSEQNITHTLLVLSHLTLIRAKAPFNRPTTWAPHSWKTPFPIAHMCTLPTFTELSLPTRKTCKNTAITADAQSTLICGKPMQINPQRKLRAHVLLLCATCWTESPGTDSPGCVCVCDLFYKRKACLSLHSGVKT